ncbi:hypothetical protein [Sphingomonas sp. SORGH_AS_0879]|uniref:hypothetical protein n=1 Tax=Sphingomonas sp. SORGH_AS_0879 TaxID=3041790 RepID=UPI0027D86669|nr:hypothetical protein [Sphingomonas sp. SORGH_AS_0879]
MARLLNAQHEEALEDARFDLVRAAWKRTAPDETAVDWAKLTFADRRDLMKLDIDAYRATLMAPHWERPIVADRISQRLAALEQLRAYREAIRANDERHAYSRAVERCELAIERTCEAEATLMNMPAPHCQALLWKLQTILVIDADGSTSSWSGSYVEQTIADMSRLLGTDAQFHP